MLTILLISNYLKREQFAKGNQPKGKISNAPSSGVKFLVADGGTLFGHSERLDSVTE